MNFSMMNDENDFPDPNELANARYRLAIQADQLARFLGPFWAGSTLIGAGVGLATRHMGTSKAAQWLRDLATELENSEPLKN